MNRRVPGTQTNFDLGDLEVGVRYAVSVKALIGSDEGEPATVFITTGVCIYTFSDVRGCVFEVVSTSGSYRNKCY